MEEVWKTIKHYRGMYQVSDLGRVRNIKKKADGTRKNVLVSTFDNGRGYDYVHLYKDGETKNFRVNRLVAQAFIPSYSKKRTDVDHIDGNKKNNQVKNLRWLTHKRNCQLAAERRKLDFK